MPSGEFLLEVRTEEIPARMLEGGIRELATRLFEELVACRLVPDEVRTGFTPRRLVVSLDGLPSREPDRTERQTGPPAAVAWDDDDRPTAALEGFAERCGVEPEEVQRVETEKGLYAGVEAVRRGRPASQVLEEIVPRTLRGLHWPKAMRWNRDSGPWVRPVHGLLSLLDGAVVPYELFGVEAGTSTVGHPIHSPEPFEVEGWEDYLEQLSERQIEIRFEPRRARLERRLAAAAEASDGEMVPDEELLSHLTAMCEIPGVVAGRFDEEFLELPREVLRASLRGHQSAFMVESDDLIVPVFLTVMDRPDDPEGLVRKGNEWVVRARLSDARFFFHEDRGSSLEERAKMLDQLSFHDRLGSYAEKLSRLTELSELLCAELGWPQVAAPARQAAALSKADLMTGMVREFPKLQGVIGGVYAREEGQPEEIWQAIYDQYLPASSEEAIPRGRVGQVVALADRVDTLVGLFGLGEIPTGSRDPFGLRRAAQGIVRILLEAELALDLDLVIAKGVRLYDRRLESSVDDVLTAIRPFLQDRIRHLLAREGYAGDEIEASLAAGISDLPDLRARVAALHEMRNRPGFGEIVQAARRIVNILREQPEYELDQELLREEAEEALFSAGRELEAEVAAATARREYERGLAAVAEFAGVLDRFFEEVLVMDDDPSLRQNRLALLQQTGRTLSRLAQLHELSEEPRPRAGEGKESKA